MSKSERPPYVSGFCNPTLPRTTAYDPHQQCPGQNDGRPCACRADGCPCYTANLRRAIGPGTIMCGTPTQGDLEVVAQFTDALRIPDPNERAAAMDAAAPPLQQQGGVATVTYGYGTTGYTDGATAEVRVTGDRWVWDADAAAEIMLQEAGGCPMCTENWPVHMFLDDGRVACP